jgi:hypothetical protein
MSYERAEILDALQGIAIVLRAQRETSMAEGVERAEAYNRALKEPRP